jgi:hypothetical protein
MRAAVFHEPGRVEAGDRPDASLREPTDAVVRVALACVCGTPQLLPDVLDGRINPGRVLDYATDLEAIADAYAAAGRSSLRTRGDGLMRVDRRRAAPHPPAPRPQRPASGTRGGGHLRQAPSA